MPETTSPPGVTSRALTFAFRLPDGAWRVCRGKAQLLGDRLHAIDVPGLGTRAGSAGSGGLSGFFHVVYRVWGGEDGARRGTVVRWEVEDGAVTRTDEADADAVLVE